MYCSICKKIVALIVCLTIIEAVVNDLPSYFPRCKRSDVNLNKCLIQATETVKPFLIKGVPELGIPSIEPFTIPQIVLQQGTSALNFKAVLRNLTAIGLSSYKFSQFDFDVPNFQFFTKAIINNLNLIGNYEMSGKILVAQIQGNGIFKAQLKNCNVTIYQKLKLNKRKGLEYLKPIITNSSIEVGEPKVALDGLFDGNEELNNAMNAIINNNIEVLFEELKPLIEQVITNIVEDLLFKVIEDNVPFDKLYPKS